MTNLVNRPILFWEIHPSKIPDALQNSADFVIVRVFEYGELDDIFDVIRLYGVNKTKEVLKRATLQQTAAAMAYIFLGIDRYGKYDS